MHGGILEVFWRHFGGYFIKFKFIYDFTKSQNLFHKNMTFFRNKLK